MPEARGAMTHFSGFELQMKNPASAGFLLGIVLKERLLVSFAAIDWRRMYECWAWGEIRVAIS